MTHSANPNDDIPGYPAEATAEDIALREPKPEHMDFLTPEQAEKRWKASGTESTTYRVWSVKGNTILFNDPVSSFAITTTLWRN